MSHTAVYEVEELLRKLVPASDRFRGRVYTVGGYVRDRELGLPAKDLDLVVEREGGAEEFCQWLHDQWPDQISKPHRIGAAYPIWQLAFKQNIETLGRLFETAGASIEVADTQAECFPDPNTRQRITRYGDLGQDVQRRDFSVNMLYGDLTTGEIVDPSGRGLADLKAGRLCGHPAVEMRKIFSDDPLRMLRLLRFHTRFGWEIDPPVIEALRDSAGRVKILSSERIRDEILKICESGKLHLALKLMETHGLLPELFPELMPMLGCTQDRIYHAEGDVWTHTLLVVAHAPPTPALQLAALLHDVGKPATRTEHGGRIKFLGHENLSVEIGREFLQRLKFESGLSEKVLHLVKLHLRGGDALSWKGLKPARKLLRDAGEHIEELLKLIEADSRSSQGPDGQSRLEHLPVLREALRRAGVVPIAVRPALNGHEIMELLKLGAGPEVGRARKLLEQIEDDWATEHGQKLDAETAKTELQRLWINN